MKLPRLGIGLKLFISYFIISSAVAWVVFEQVSMRITKGIDQAAEDVMVDTSNLLAQMVSQFIYSDTLDVPRVRLTISNYLNRELNAKIYSVNKKSPNLHIYITNNKGIVIFDSKGLSEGKDFGEWPDVEKTLSGNYGARTSSSNPNNFNPTSEQKALFVAAPIYNDDQLFGVLTVIKPVKDLKPYIIEQRSELKLFAIFLFLLSILFGAGASYAITRTTNKLVKYTTQLSKGKKVQAPKIRQIEFAELTSAIEKLRTDLEGREYVEEYINTMAHELRTPITGIKATAENLLMPMTDKQRKRFIENILDSNNRMNLLVNRLLELSRIERRDELVDATNVDVKTLIEEVIKVPTRTDKITSKSIILNYEIERGFSVMVEKLLAEQAIGNILDNAIDFTKDGSTITIKVNESNKTINIHILDQGEGMGEHERKQLFRRFFSSIRPGTGKRGNGLGLRFVKKIMDLHGGHVILKNRFMEDGAEAILKFPINV
ncbi:MAG TPA: two-component system sensor histidine kinase CreC [Candidatus Thioglobus sp.]|jgi:two-component system sensor histidine kinase CreC|nr:two-component system sensor histidine kinase CreC [Candidatus Thioglobus sp.]HIL43099.1 two-component system sensor histidine kinase CreC [Gammaproteobacteria bacterium]